MKKNLIFIIAISFVGILAMSGCGCGISEPTGSLRGNGYVDLGLPSGTLWATCNIGADDPNDVGDYFAYGELWAKDNYFDSNYSYQFKSNILSPSDDAATFHWGEDWHMPTNEDFEELMSSCRWEWTSHYFQKGYKITGPNGNSIFLPTTGNGSRAKTLTKYGYYRTSSAIFINDDVLRRWTAFTFLFSEDSYRIEDVMPRPVDGVAIRPVSSSACQTSSNKKKNVKSDEEIKQEVKDFVLNCYKDYYDETIYSNDLKQARKNWRKTESSDCIDAQYIFYDREYDDGCGSWCDKKDFSYNVDDVYLISDDEIKVSVSYTYKVYSAYDDNKFIAKVNHKDKFTLIKENGRWVIDDLVRDGVSSKDAYRRNDKRFGRDCC